MGYFELHNRRYVGSKYKLLNWIDKLVAENCKGKSFFDVFAGTGVVTAREINNYDTFILNDFLYSNEVIYRAFFESNYVSFDKLEGMKEKYNNLDTTRLDSNYFDNNFGGKFFAADDSRIIGFIREDIEREKTLNNISEKEFNVLLASLLYSADKIANTVGHYDAYFKRKAISNRFVFELIKPIETANKRIKIYRSDSNELAKIVSADVAFVDPPYNSRQYSRFYHVLENLAQWKKPELYGVALKPQPENMSDYCRNSAVSVFEDLILNLKVTYIVVTYNNTYNSKSSSSKNKIELDDIKRILEKRGETKIFQKEHSFFNAGKTEFNNHLEYLFITEVSS